MALKTHQFARGAKYRLVKNSLFSVWWCIDVDDDDESNVGGGGSERAFLAWDGIETAPPPRGERKMMKKVYSGKILLLISILLLCRFSI